MAVKPTAEYLDLLNQAVSREIKASIQYILQHTKMEKIKKKVSSSNIQSDKSMYDTIGGFLKTFAIQEMKHLGMIMERLYIIGGEAVTKSSKPKIGDTIGAFAKNGEDIEKEAMELYRKIIDMAESLGDYETAEMFRVIYREEEVHLHKFEEYLEFPLDEDGEDLEDPQFLKSLKPEYFEMLNKALAMELSAIIQYTNQHEKVSMKALRLRKKRMEGVKDRNKAEVISDLLKNVFLQEMDHYEKIAERIFTLKGECGVVPDPFPKIGQTPEDFLKLARVAEDETIMFYRKVIEEASKVGDIITKKMFEEFLMQEEEHFWSFDDFF